ncbi:MAG: nickel-dependent lactate racemase [Spirochaetaceae bacterium]|nr:MAG: nickel-dependent lactate racemase [Spirochaetaceae bacterium]
MVLHQQAQLAMLPMRRRRVVKIRIAYGKHGLDIEVPDSYQPVVLRSAVDHPLADPQAALRSALRDPIASPSLHDIAARALERTSGGRARAGIVFNDISRATPNDVMLPVIIEELRDAGIRDEHITLFNATGTHRENSVDELRMILSDDLVRRYTIVQNDCTAEGVHTEIGTTAAGNRVKVMTQFLDQDIRIATGFIEPHFFAGFSGGGKAVVPGLAHLETILHNHGPHHMDHPDAIWGKTEGNPLWEDLAEAAALAEPVFLVNVTMTPDQRITAVFTGDRVEAHAAGCRHVARHALVPVDRAFDIVVTSNSGYPLDLNLYQAVKGMSAAGRIVRPGGQIIVAAECWDGLPDHGLFATLVMEAGSADELLDRLRGEDLRVRDAWQAHILALLRTKAEITLVSDRLTTGDIPQALCGWAPTVEDAIRDAALQMDHTPSICILPDGPLTIPVLPVK